MTTEPGADLDAARCLVVERDLTTPAIAALTGVVRGLPLESLTPVKQSLKRFFSTEPWTAADDDALAAVVGPGSGSEQLALDPELTLTWGWDRQRFFVRVATAAAGDLAESFESDVFPEATPSPRTIRFTTPPLHSGASRFYNSAAEAADDAPAARLFTAFDAVTNVLVGPDFVAVTIARPDQWDALLAPILRTVAEEFTGALTDPTEDAPRTAAELDGSRHSDHPDRSRHDGERRPRRLEQAWSDLGSLRARRPDDLDRIITAARDDEPARRQVAAALLADAPPAIAARAWGDLSADESRSVRRSTIDAVVDANREELRPLLERALTDSDPWIRWKAVRGIAALGITPSRAAIDARAADSDFRVRLEATRALADPLT